MASRQLQRGAELKSELPGSKLGSMASRQLQRGGERKSELPQLPQDRTFGTIFNHTHTNMDIIASHSWTGSFVHVPDFIPFHGATQFIHQRGEQGSKAGVAYTVSSGAPGEYAYILAWEAPAIYNPPNTPNAICLLCGTKEDVEALDWDVVLEELDRSCNSSGATEADGKFRGEAIIARFGEHPAATIDCHFNIIP